MRTWSDVREKIKSVSEDEKEEIQLAANLVASLIDKRTELGLSQRDLSKMSGVKQSAIARLESLNAIPRIDTLAKVSKSLGLELRLVPTKR